MIGSFYDAQNLLLYIKLHLCCYYDGVFFSSWVGGGGYIERSRMRAPRALTPSAISITTPATTVPTNMPAPVNAPKLSW